MGYLVLACGKEAGFGGVAEGESKISNDWNTDMNGMKNSEVSREAGAHVLTTPAGYQNASREWVAKQEMGQGATGIIRKELAAAWAACGGFEWWAFGYLGASSVLIALFAEHLQHPVRLLALRAAVVCVVLLLCRIQASYGEYSANERPSLVARWWHFWRYWYPHL